MERNKTEKALRCNGKGITRTSTCKENKEKENRR